MNLGSYNWQTAITVAKEYKGGGLNDWRLPTKEELNVIYQNLKKKGLGGIFEEWYWSSSENNINSAWVQYFSDGDQYNLVKGSTRCVRAVRAF
jgi:hypothetical protein